MSRQDQWQAVSEDWFVGRSTEDLARAMLNLVLVRESPRGVIVGRVVECEMYQGPQDRGAHSFGGVPTRRTAVMYGPPGNAYVYFIYGMYWCLNVVSAPAGVPHAILFRALEPLVGMDILDIGKTHDTSLDHRKRACSGPGRLCRALGIDGQYYGHPLSKPPLYLARWPVDWPPYRVARGPRVNIAYAGEAKDWPWRFWVHEHPCVSRPRGPLSYLEDPAPWPG